MHRRADGENRDKERGEADADKGAVANRFTHGEAWQIPAVLLHGVRHLQAAIFRLPSPVARVIEERHHQHEDDAGPAKAHDHIGQLPAIFRNQVSRDHGREEGGNCRA